MITFTSWVKNYYTALRQRYYFWRYTRAMKRFSKSIERLNKTIGKKLIPTLQDYLTTFENMPEMEDEDDSC